MKLLVCGDRNWTDEKRILGVLEQFVDETVDVTIIHGAARGADRIAGRIAAELGFTVIPVPADWESHGRAAGPIRNQVMLDMKPDEVIAFHSNLDVSKGTKDMVTRARKVGVPVVVVGSHTKANHTEGDAMKMEQMDMLEGFADKGRRAQIAVDKATEKARKKVRPTAPATSKAAAKSLKDVTRSQQAVLDCFKRHGPMCDSDMSLHYNKDVLLAGWPWQSPSGLRTRRDELVEKGMLADSGERKTLESGNKSIVWKAV